MDKEALLKYFQENYLSQDEVLARLPVNIPFENFWKELTLRRRSGAVTLPLLNASGEPYWFHITEPMVRVSERISAEMMKIKEPVDPYAAGMTTAMTEEMFYTSYLEGASMEYDDAMKFLCADREPSDTMELMLWNNRHAWEEMIARLWMPLDEERIRLLAWLLTKDMEGQADDYRRGNEHEIAAIESGDYVLPSVDQVPERMKGLYTYIGKSSIHPLIKAAVSQAYILAVRPYDEGNERLSRIIATAILLRSGYDFFRDISISGIITRESLRYYNAMKEIHREDNSGDLTYFIDYYFGLLNRTLDLREDRTRRNAENELKKQREMAIMPIEKITESDMAAEPLTGMSLELSDDREAVINHGTAVEILQETEPAAISESEKNNTADAVQDELRPIHTAEDNIRKSAVRKQLIAYLQKKYVETAPEALRIYHGVRAESVMKLLAEMYIDGKDAYTCAECSKLLNRSMQTANQYCKILRDLNSVIFKLVKTNTFCYSTYPDVNVSAILADLGNADCGKIENTECRNNSTVLCEAADPENAALTEVILKLLSKKYATPENKHLEGLRGQSIESALKMLAKMYISKRTAYTSLSCMKIANLGRSAVNSYFQTLRAIGAVDYSIINDMGNGKRHYSYTLHEDPEIEEILRGDDGSRKNSFVSSERNDDIPPTGCKDMDAVGLISMRSDLIQTLIDIDNQTGEKGFTVADASRLTALSRHTWNDKLKRLTERGVLHRNYIGNSMREFRYYLDPKIKVLLSNAIRNNTPGTQADSIRLCANQ